MKKSFMQNQREIDHDAEVELDMERIEQDMRETLLAGEEFPLTYRRGGIYRMTATYDRDDVVNEMVDLDEDAFNLAVMMTRNDPIEAAKILTDLMKRAVEQVIGRAPIREAAEFEEREEAA